MKQSIIHIALVVRDYDEAIEFYTQQLHFTLIEDTFQPEQNKRWVVMAPPGSIGTTLLLARASTPVQEAFIGNQTGGRVFLFLDTDDFWRDYNEDFSKLKKVVNFRAKTPISIVQNRELGGKCSDERSEKKTISFRLDRCPMEIYQTAVTTADRNRATTSG